uniref:Antistasin-like domain-containing protein n=1 Tax=Strigamia maritima TaxID=126957 RepID=T1JPC1_STRMM
MLMPVFLTTCPVPDCSKFECDLPIPGLSIGSDGCAHCDCSKHAIDEDCPNLCPSDCGQHRKDNGCLQCTCGQLWYNPPTPPPSTE